MYLLELLFKLPVAMYDSGFNFDLTVESFKNLVLHNATCGGDISELGELFSVSH